MEFLELLDEIKPFIPAGYEWVTAAIDRFYPYLSFAVGFLGTALVGIFLLPSWNT